MTTMNHVVHLPEYGFLRISGKDAIKFMQGYATCDLGDLSPETSGLGAVCNLQGRMVTSFRIVSVNDGLLLRMRRELVATTMEFLGKYIVFSKAEMQDVSDEIHCFGMLDGNVEGIGDAARSRTTIDGSDFIRVSDTRFEVWSTNSSFGEVDDTTPWWRADVADGIAFVTIDTTNEFIPQMLGYHELGAIDFDKGCYLGQEIVARMQYRGAVNRKLHRGEAGAALNIGDSLNSGGGKALGLVVAAADNLFLAVIQAKDKTPECFASGQPVSLELVTR